MQVGPALWRIRNLSEEGADASGAVYELVIVHVEDVREAGGACTWNDRRDVCRLPSQSVSQCYTTSSTGHRLN